MSKKELLISKTKEIIEQYEQRLTIRQIYYRLVSKNIIKNTINEYKYLSKVLVDARIQGEIPFETIEDRVREFIGGDKEYTEPEEHFNAWYRAFRRCHKIYEMPKWQGQPKYVEVWLEKKALQGVFSSVTDEMNVRLAPCGGYPSLTYLYEAARELKGIENKEKVILYFGDFDMRGKDIERVITGYLQQCFGINVIIERCALTKDQIEKYELPPQPAKTTDSMWKGWVEEHGNVAWELDALPPDVLQEIIKESIAKHFDEWIYEETLRLQEERRKQIKEMVDEILGGEE